MDENSSSSAAMLTKAFLLITSMTGAAIMHAHHTPKNRDKDPDEYRADNSAWRGSGAIYSSLDCGFTLANWMPSGGNDRKEWRRNALEQNLGRWIVLDTGKIREGSPLQPIVYELQGCDLPEGFEIGVCHLSTSEDALNSLSVSGGDAILALHLAEKIIGICGYGDHSATDVHDSMRAEDGWPSKADRMPSGLMDRMYDMFQQPVSTSVGSVTLLLNEARKTTGRWTFKCTNI
jgi:hypothetical protein